MRKLASFYLLIIIIFMSIVYQPVYAQTIKTEIINGYEFMVKDLTKYKDVNFISTQYNGYPLLKVQGYKDKWGITDINGNVLIPVKYDSIMDIQAGNVKVTSNGLSAVLNYKTGEIVIDFGQYNHIGLYDNVIMVVENDNYHYYSSNGDKLSFNTNIDFVRFVHSKYYIGRLNNKWGLFNLDLKEIIPFEYDTITDYRVTLDGANKYYFVVEKDGEFELIDENGNELLESDYRYFNINPDSEYIDITSTNGFPYRYNLKTFTTSNRHQIDYNEYDTFQQYDEKSYFFIKNNEAGLMDLNYNKIESVSVNNGRIKKRHKNGLYEVHYDSISQYLAKRKYLNSNGKTLASDYGFSLDSLYNNSDFIIVNRFKKKPTKHYTTFYPYTGVHHFFYAGDERLDFNLGVINSVGEEIIPCKYDRILNFGYTLKGHFLVEDNDKYGFINAKGEIVVPVEYDSINLVPLSYDDKTYAVLKKNDKWSIVNEQGEIIYPFELDEKNMTISDGLIINSVNGKWEAIDLSGNIVVPFIHDTKVSSKFVNGFAVFGKGMNRMYYDSNWNFVVEKAQLGLVSSNGDTVIPFGDYYSSALTDNYSLVLTKTDNGIKLYELIK
ncbi:WG repeat-containing protein [Alkaliphilus pronyensis]|uniref:WG repeat-containing protein n=1 Tax=Alkaliphilus pronyensis TaxID=1482732 RepID=A0A6I0EWI8_9FIRM|nr:WG repeat-containing protein [Alkaliphilus pronyensis]KAB3529885.1 WG repeat-containing protein [Alkaliphilus pronyensis]